MIICVLVFGIWVGNTVSPVFLWTTPVLAFLLVRVQLRETRARLADDELGLRRLPPALQRQVKAALAQLPAGEVRDLLLGIARVGSNATGFLPRGYAETDYGRTIEELVSAAADTAVHTASFDTTVRELDAQSTLVDTLDKVRAARDTRIAQLTTALRVLSEIGPDIADAGDAGTRRMLEILDSLKREVSEHEAAETEIETLLAAAPSR